MFRRTALALLLATTGLGLSAATSSAAQSYSGYIYESDSPRAFWTYDRDSNKLCTRTFTGARTSSTVSVTAPSRETTPGSWSHTVGDAGIVSDTGGDAAPSCIRVKATWDDVQLDVRGDWHGSGSGYGSTRPGYGDGYVYG